MFNSETKEHDETNERFVKKFDRRRCMWHVEWLQHVQIPAVADSKNANVLTQFFCKTSREKRLMLLRKKCFWKRDCAREVTLLKLMASW